MKWIKKHAFIFILLISIVALATFILVSIFNSGDNIVTSYIRGIATTIEKPFVSMGKTLGKPFKAISNYSTLQKENDKLKKENDELRDQLMKAKLDESQLSSLQELSEALNYVPDTQERSLVTADIINFNGTSHIVSFTINVGKNEGIKKGSAVLGGKGLIGCVTDVGRSWSKVVSIVDSNSHLTFKLEGNMDILGVIDGPDDGRLNGYMLDPNIQPQVGERIVTSGMGAYPAGIPIGTIVKSSFDSNSQIYRVLIKPAVNFKGIQKVTVVL